MGMTYDDAIRNSMAKGAEYAKKAAEALNKDIENNGLYWHRRHNELRQELEHERYNVEKTAQEGARRLKEAAAEHIKLLSAFNEAEGTILKLDNALREAREQLICLRDGGAEHPDTQRIIDKIWHLTNFDGYPPAHEQWGDGVAECPDWSNK